MDRRPTIIDVARKAGVSKSTVSLVLHNSPAVRSETRAEVRRAIVELGYVYNRAAANLRSANAGLIGLVINDLRNPFFTEFATSLQMALAMRGYAAVVANTDETPSLQAQVVGAMIEHGVAALVISPTYGDDHGAFSAIARAGIPAMQVLRRADGRTDLFPFAAPDYERGSRLATEHLVRSGATRIAFVGGLPRREVTEERMSGYNHLVTETGHAPLVLPGRASRALGREAARWLAADHPEVDAVICFNDLVALGLLAGCAAIGRPVGSGFQIVGFDDIEDCALTYPTLSSIRCDIARFGERVAVMVLDWLENGAKPPIVTRTAVELVVRDSSGGRP